MQKLLFLCTGNSCRSQMAEGFARQCAPEGWSVESAGVEAHGLNPLAVRVMAEIDIDISQQESTVLPYDQLNQFNSIITVCGHAEETCPMTPPEVERLHWPLEDPAAATGTRDEKLQVFRQVRDQLRELVAEWCREQQPENS